MAVLIRRGLGASGAFATAAATVVDAASPAAARANAFFADHLDAGGLLRDWLVVEVIGVVIGGFASAALAGRLRLAVDRGPRTSVSARVLLAVGGGAIMGAGAVLATQGKSEPRVVPVIDPTLPKAVRDPLGQIAVRVDP